MSIKRKGSLLPITYVFGSFFGAIMIAAVFAYNNYRFSKYKFIDFSDIYLYEKSDIFVPTSDKYMLLVFSSNQSNLADVLHKLNSNLPIIAVDMFQKRLDSNSTLSYVSSDINTILKIMNNLGINSIPSAVSIVHQGKNKLYKQNSEIKKF